MMGVQLTKDYFERLIWDSGLDPAGKLVALAIKWHINSRTNEAFVGVRRLSDMVGRDERTIRRYLKDIQRVLGVDIVATPGKVNTFRLRVFETAEEIHQLLSADEWKGSKWLLFRPSELDELIRQIGAVIRGDENSQIEIPLTPMSGLSPVSGEDCHPCQGTPVTGVSHNHYITSSLTSNAATGANGVAHKAVAPRKSRVQATTSNPDFEVFFGKYQAAMRAQPGNGNAATRADIMPDRKARNLWAKLKPEDATAAETFIPAFAAKSRSYMSNANTYLENKPWRRANGTSKQQEAERELYLTILMTYRLKGEWPQEARDHWGAPPDTAGTRVPPELWQEAQERAKRSLNGAAHHG
jgi:hypothetical protein